MRPPAAPKVLALSLLALGACTSGAAPGDRDERVAAADAPIVGGQADTTRSYVVGVGDAMGAICTGTVISRRTVLTAGHCYAPGMGAQGGLTRVFFGPDLASSPTIVETTRAIRHPGYNDATTSNDLCVVELAEDAPSQAAPLLRETLDASFIGPDFTFVGYGDDGMGHYDLRRAVSFPIAAIGPSDAGKQSGTGPIDATMFYYSTPMKNTCTGDSGGPGFAVRKGVERVAGVTSFGDDACVIDGVDGRADATAIAIFLQPMIDLLEGMAPCRADGFCNESCNVGHELVDPDCAESHCGADGLCAIACVAPVDPDCIGASTGAATAASGAITGAGVGGGDGDGGAGGGSGTTHAKGCGCRTAGGDDGTAGGAAWGLVAVALAVQRRKSRRRA